MNKPIAGSILGSVKMMAAVAVVVALTVTSVTAAITMSEPEATNLIANAGPDIIRLEADHDDASVWEVVLWKASAIAHVRGDDLYGLLFTWDWDDGNFTVVHLEYSTSYSIGTSVESHAWSEPGTYEVSVSVWDGYATQQNEEHNVSASLSFTVNPLQANSAPVAVAYVEPQEGTVDTVFTFDASMSFDMEDAVDLLLVRWDWTSDGDWDTAYTNVKSTTHAFLVAGVYAVTLEVMDTGNLTDSTCVEVTVTTAYELSPHAPIHIEGNLEFAAMAAAEGWQGDGSESDPYMIGLYEIAVEETEDAISIMYTDVHFMVWRCALSGPQTGIYMLDVAHASILANTFDAFPMYSVYAEESEDITIKENTITGGTHCIGLISTDGAYLWNNTVQCSGQRSLVMAYATHVTMVGNAFSGAGGIDIWGYLVEHWNSHDIDASNTVNGGPVYYYRDVVDSDTPTTAGQIILANCTGMNVSSAVTGSITLGFSSWNRIVGSSVSDVYCGVSIWFSPNNTVMSSEMTDCVYGVEMRNSPDCQLVNNIIQSPLYGMWIQQSDRTTLLNNSVLNSEWTGILLYYSSFGEVRLNTLAYGLMTGLDLVCAESNVIASNNFMDNILQVDLYESPGNIWNDPYPAGGNYWSDYLGEDIYSGIDQTEPSPDGIGDTPYLIGSADQDFYPLMAPAVPGPVNAMPTASFTVTPETGTTDTVFEFDASDSCDLEDPTDDLEVRWDWEADGDYDTEWTLTKSATHQYSTTGTFMVALQVRDTAGLVGLAERTVEVTDDPETMDPAHFVLGFNVTDAVFDPIRPYVYITDKYAKTLHFVNLESGEVDKTFAFGYMTESLAITPDSSRLYVALLTREHSSYWFDDEGHVGYIASIDLETQVKDTEYMINEDPGDILITSNGHLVVGSGSGQWTYIRVYEAEDGTEISNYWLFRQDSRLALHPSESIVYAADVDVSPSDIWRYDLSASGAITYVGTSPYHGDYRISGNVWTSPLGDELITRGGDVFTAGMPFESDMTYVTSMTPVGSLVEGLCYDAAKDVIFTGEGNSMRYYAMSNHLTLGGIEMGLPVCFIGAYSDLVGLVLRGYGSTDVVLVPHPMPEGPDNTYPSAVLTVTPEAGTTLTDFCFDASASSDSQDTLAELQFRWDFEGDGQWDTAYSSSPTVVNRYDIAGSFVARVEVMDSLGWSSVATASVQVALQDDPGDEGEEHEPFMLPYPVTDAAFDPVRPYMYVTSKYLNSVFFVNLETGFTEKQFTFDLMTESITITPDGSRMYVALLVAEHDYYWFSERRGEIACFDLVEGVKDNQYEINEDPFDLVATSNGQIVVSSGSGQWTYIKAYDADDGTELGSAGIRQMCRLSLHPSETMVYSADTDSSPSDIERFDLSEDGTLTAVGDSPYHGEYEMAGNVWVNPLGDSLIVRGGHVFTAGMPINQDMYYVTTMTLSAVTSVAFDVSGGAVFSLEGEYLRWYDLDSYSYIGSNLTGAVMEFVGLSQGLVYCLDVQTSLTVVAVWDNPLG